MNKIIAISALAFTLGLGGEAVAASPAVQGGFQGPGLPVSSVAEAEKMSDDTPVVLVGQIEKSLGDEKYLFKDKTGSIAVEIDNEDWNGLVVKPEDTVEIRGEVDKGFRSTEIDVDQIVKK